MKFISLSQELDTLLLIIINLHRWRNNNEHLCNARHSRLMNLYQKMNLSHFLNDRICYTKKKKRVFIKTRQCQKKKKCSFTGWINDTEKISFFLTKYNKLRIKLINTTRNIWWLLNWRKQLNLILEFQELERRILRRNS